MTRINDPDQKVQLFAQMDSLVESPIRLSITAMKKRGWVVVPAESCDCHFSDPDNDEQQIRQIIDACRLEKIDKVFAVPVYETFKSNEKVQLDLEYYQVPVTLNGFLEFGHECFSFNYLLFPENVSFTILATREDYLLAAGEPEFITTLLGTSITQARNNFIDFAKDWTIPRMENFFLDVANYYNWSK